MSAEHTPHSDLDYARDLAGGYAVPGALGHVNVLARAVLDLFEQLEALQEWAEVRPARASGDRNWDAWAAKCPHDPYPASRQDG